MMTVNFPFDGSKNSTIYICTYIVNGTIFRVNNDNEKLAI